MRSPRSLSPPSNATLTSFGMEASWGGRSLLRRDDEEAELWPCSEGPLGDDGGDGEPNKAFSISIVPFILGDDDGDGEPNKAFSIAPFIGAAAHTQHARFKF